MYCCLITSMTPRVVRRRAGMTGSDMNDSVMNGKSRRETRSSSKALLRRLVVDLDKAVLAR